MCISKHKAKRLKKNKASTSKTIVAISGVVTLGIILFSCYEMHIQQDLSALYALIGIAASDTAVILGYFTKAKAENSAGGITYDMAMTSAQAAAQTEAPSEDPEV